MKKMLMSLVLCLVLLCTAGVACASSVPEYVATVETNGETKSYTNFLDAWNALQENSTLILLKDVEKADAMIVNIKIPKNVTIDLNNHNLYWYVSSYLVSKDPSDPGIFEIRNGSLKGDDSAVYIYNVIQVTLSDITLSCAYTDATGCVRAGSFSTVTIGENVTFSSDVTAIVYGYDATVDLSGATIPADGWKIKCEASNGMNVVADSTSAGLVLPVGAALTDKDGKVVTSLAEDETGTIICTHPGATTENKCTACGAALVAKVSVGSEETYYTQAHLALNAASGKTATVDLLTDAEIAEIVNLQGSATDIALNLNGNTVTISAKIQLSVGSLKISGGNIETGETGRYAISVGDDTALTLENVAYSATATDAKMLDSGGTLIIDGGSITATSKNNPPVYVSGGSETTIKNSAKFNVDGTDICIGIFNQNTVPKLDVSQAANPAEWQISVNVLEEWAEASIGTHILLPAGYGMLKDGEMVDALYNGETGTIHAHNYNTYTTTATHHTLACSCGAESATGAELHTFTEQQDKTWKCVCGAQAVAKVSDATTETYYTAIGDAITAWGNGTTLTLLADVTAAGKVHFYEKTPMDATLDLNGHTLTFNDYTHYIYVYENNKLTVVDSTNGEGTIKNTTRGLSINNSGTTTIKSGTVGCVMNSAGKTLNIESGTVTAGEEDRVAVANSGKLYISGGTVTAPAGDAIQNDTGGEIEITNGTVTASGIAINCYHKSKLTIYGGEVTGKYAVCTYGTADTIPAVTISGKPDINGTAADLRWNDYGTFDLSDTKDNVIDGWSVYNISTDTAMAASVFTLPENYYLMDAAEGGKVLTTLAKESTGYIVRQAPTYTVNFNTDGGSAVAIQTVKEGDKATKPADPTKENCNFGGWYADEGCTTEFAFSTAIIGDTTIYAKWISLYTVTFDTDGGSFVTSKDVPDGSTIPQPTTTRDGWEFGGWYADDKYETLFDFTKGITGPTTVYAKWILPQNPDFTVLLDYNASSSGTSKEYGYSYTWDKDTKTLTLNLNNSGTKGSVCSTDGSITLPGLYSTSSSDSPSTIINTNATTTVPTLRMDGEKSCYNKITFAGNETLMIKDLSVYGGGDGHAIEVAEKATVVVECPMNFGASGGVASTLTVNGNLTAYGTFCGQLHIGSTGVFTSKAQVKLFGDGVDLDESLKIDANFMTNNLGKLIFDYDSEGEPVLLVGESPARVEPATATSAIVLPQNYLAYPYRVAKDEDGYFITICDDQDEQPYMDDSYKYHHVATAPFTLPMESVMLTLNANDGTFAIDDTPTEQSIKVVKRTEVPIAKVFPALSARNHYTHLGWSENADATVATYTDSITVSGDTTLYAVWKPDSFAITYESGTDGTIGGPAEAAYNSEVTLTPTASEGYILLSITYRVGDDGELVDITEAKSFKMPAGAVQVFVSWQLKKYEITYDENHDKNNDPNTTSADGLSTDAVYHGRTLTNQTPLTQTTHLWQGDPDTLTGHTFLGWKVLGSAADAPLYNPWAENAGEVTYGPITGPVTFIAQWQVNKYAINFFDDDGFTELCDPVFVEYGAEVTAPDAPTKAGYTFVCWLDEAGNETAIPATMPAENINLKAKWTENKRITTLVYTEMPFTYTPGAKVADFAPAKLAEHDGYEYFWCIDKYDGNDYIGTYWPSSMDDLAQSYWEDTTADELQDWKEGFGDTFDDEYDYTFYGHALINEGYSFGDKSNKDSIYYDVTYTNGDTDTGVSEYTVEWIDAYWYEPLSPLYKVTVKDSTGGTVTPNVSTALEGDEITLTLEPEDGYSLNSLTVTGSSGPMTVGEGYKFTMPAEDVTVETKWNVNQYTITFDTDGGNAIDPITLDYGAAVTAPADPTKTGYTFGGWMDEDGVAVDIPATMPAGDMTLTAKWTVNQYTVKWLNHDGSELEGDENVLYGTTPTYDGATPAKAADAQYSYTFTGWSPVIAPVTGDVTYTAQFSDGTNGYTVKWLNHDGSELEVDENVLYGTTPTYDGATPTKAVDAQYSYTFTGWSPAIAPVTGDATYTATFTNAANIYRLTVINGTGSGEYAVDATVIITAGTAPEGKHFAGWKGLEGLTITNGSATTNSVTFTMPARDVTITAEYGETVIAATGVVLNEHQLNLTVGDTFALIATVLPENASNKNVSWSNSDAAVATFTEGTAARTATADAQGVVTAQKTGTTVITVTTEDGAHTDACTVVVTEKVLPLKVTPAGTTEVSVMEGESGEMRVSASGGTEPYQYQWYVDRGNGFVPYEDSNAAVHATAPAELTNNGFRYFCRVTDASGQTADSEIFTLEVLKAPEIPETGDNSQIGLWMTMCAISLVGIVFLSRKKKADA